MLMRRLELKGLNDHESSPTVQAEKKIHIVLSVLQNEVSVAEAEAGKGV